MALQKKRKPAIRQKFASYRLLIRRSEIHRWGVFTCEAIPAESRVIEYAGEKIKLDEARRRYGAPQDSKRWKPTYLFRLNSRWIIDGAVRGSGAEIINHCCDPNLRTWVRRGRLHYVSVRPILAGEELTIDYKFAPDLPKVPCHCGSKKCRGSINRRAEKPKRKR